LKQYDTKHEWDTPTWPFFFQEHEKKTIIFVARNTYIMSYSPSNIRVSGICAMDAISNHGALKQHFLMRNWQYD
jgi:hypothetical protein